MDNSYWSCGISTSCLYRFELNGTLLTRIAIPVPVPTMLCVGGQNMRTAFVTTLREGLDPARLANHPSAGKVFVLDLDVAGAHLSNLQT